MPYLTIDPEDIGRSYSYAATTMLRFAKILRSRSFRTRGPISSIGKM